MLRGLRQYRAVSTNAFKVVLSDPVYLVLMLGSLASLAFFSSLPSFSFGSEIRFVRDQALALMFIGGCVCIMLGSLSTIVRDLHLGATAVLMSRPISGFRVMAGKLTGMIGALAVFHITVGVGVLWVTRVAGAHVHEQELDAFALTAYLSVIVLAMALAGFRHYFLGGWFAWQASLLVFAVTVGSFLLINFFGSATELQAWGQGVDWRSMFGILFLFFAELIFLSIILVLAVMFDAPLVLGGGVMIFLLGMVTQYLAVSLSPIGWLRTLISSILPNWQAYWVSDILAEKGPMEIARLTGYLGSCAIHSFLYVVMMLLVATWAFKRKEVCASDNLQEN